MTYGWQAQGRQGAAFQRGWTPKNPTVCNQTAGLGRDEDDSQGHYTILEILNSTLILLVVAAAIGIWGFIGYRELTKPEPVMGVDYFPMANQHITWEGAGYQKLIQTEAGR